MKKIMLVAIIALALCQINAFARDVDAKKWEISLQGAGVIPNDTDIDPTYYVGGRIAYNINKNVSVAGESGWMGWDDSDGTTKYGEVNGIPLLADLILKMPIEATENKLVPYVLGGVGVVFWDYKEEAILTSNGITVDGDTSFAARLGAGVDYYVSDNIALFAEASYLFSDYDIKVNAGGIIAGAKTDTDAVFAGAGIKFAF